jgi:hypothetical protein
MLTPLEPIDYDKETDNDKDGEVTPLEAIDCDDDTDTGENSIPE